MTAGNCPRCGRSTINDGEVTLDRRDFHAHHRDFRSRDEIRAYVWDDDIAGYVLTGIREGHSAPFKRPHADVCEARDLRRRAERRTIANPFGGIRR